MTVTTDPQIKTSEKCGKQWTGTAGAHNRRITKGARLGPGAGAGRGREALWHRQAAPRGCEGLLATQGGPRGWPRLHRGSTYASASFCMAPFSMARTPGSAARLPAVPPGGTTSSSLSPQGPATRCTTTWHAGGCLCWRPGKPRTSLTLAEAACPGRACPSAPCTSTGASALHRSTKLRLAWPSKAQGRSSMAVNACQCFVFLCPGSRSRCTNGKIQHSRRWCGRRPAPGMAHGGPAALSSCSHLEGPIVPR